MNDSVHAQPTTSAETETETTKVIPAANPTSEEMKTICGEITANYNFNVSTKPTKFTFKKSKDKDTGIETMREAVELAVPYPSMEGIIAIIETGGKGLELLFDAVEGIVNSAARELLNEDYNLNAATFPAEKVSWEFIANIPKVQRRGGGIPKETWDEFELDYVAIMPTATGKSLEQVRNAAKIIKSKFSAVKTNEQVLNLLVDQLGVYLDATTKAEEFAECVEFLLDKADKLLNISPEELLANL